MNTSNPIQGKLPQVGTTIFTTMSGLANEHNAINLSQGFPGFSISEELISLVNKYMLEGKNQYAPMAGVLELREEISALQREFYAANYNPDSEITITSGATQGIYTTISALVHPGDEVIMFSPAYDCYGPAVEVNGGKSVFIELNSEDYSIPWEQVRDSITDRTKMISSFDNGLPFFFFRHKKNVVPTINQ